MEDYELDMIFGTHCGLPNILEMYIGIPDGDCCDKKEELTDYKYTFTLGQPAEIIHDYQLEFDYVLFDYYGAVSEISVYMPLEEKNQKRQVDRIKNYLISRYYHDKVKESIEYDAERNILELDIVISNEFYQYSISLSDDETKIVIGISATKDDYEVYEVLNELADSNFIVDIGELSCMTRNILSKYPKCLEFIKEIKAYEHS